ncbi:NmrA-like family [Aspergillus sclerotialis]|uniref:NmrA-like family n=1 Tax=Aspergillus sclerotialis TaxID=2070753 RepID=A0A3A2ZQW5_9EURO|nr:NmrA-like family [Aspergillus sclerotialis]
MHILIIGGNGRTGKLVISAALQQGHTITALVRDPDALEKTHGLTIVKGTPLSKTDITTAITQSPNPVGSIIVTLKARRATDNPFSPSIAPPRLMADCHKNLIEAMKEFSIGKIVTMSAFGVGDSSPNMNWVLRLLIRRLSNMAAEFHDHDLVDEEVRTSGVDFTLVRPVMMTEGSGLEVKEWGQTGDGVGMFAKVTRGSVAEFLLESAVGTKARVREAVVISN